MRPARTARRFDARRGGPNASRAQGDRGDCQRPRQRTGRICRDDALSAESLPAASRRAAQARIGPQLVVRRCVVARRNAGPTQRAGHQAGLSAARQRPGVRRIAFVRRARRARGAVEIGPAQIPRARADTPFDRTGLVRRRLGPALRGAAGVRRGRRRRLRGDARRSDTRDGVGRRPGGLDAARRRQQGYLGAGRGVRSRSSVCSAPPRSPST